MQKLENSDIYTVKAATHFGIDENEVTPKHRQFIKEQEFALNYGYRGSPILSYTITEEGVVDFTEKSQEVLVDQYDHRTGLYE